MVSKVYQNQKCVLEYSKKAIDRAARDIRHGCTGEDKADAIAKIQNFREVHLYPLMLMKNHLVRASNKVSKKIIVARRLKRLPTIINKLERPSLDGQGSNAIKLTRMQDIGGCRAIVKNIDELNRLRYRLENSKSVHKIIDVDDYLIPKDSGYGGVHLIYSCFDEEDDGHDYKKRKVEVQLRTELQHSWATSLEIIDTLEGFELKTSLEGHDQWRRYFYLAGMLVAHREGANVLSEEELGVIQVELTHLDNELDILRKLASYSIAMNYVNPKNFPRKRANLQGMFLVTLVKSGEGKGAAFQATVVHYNSKSSHRALEHLRSSEADEGIQIAVLLSSSNVRTLKQAYPNYFGSTKKFAEFIISQTDKGIAYAEKILAENGVDV